MTKTDVPTATVSRRVPPQRLVDLANPAVRGLAASPAHSLLDRTTLVLHVTGRRTGRRYDLPVSFVKMGGEFLVVTQHRWRVNLRGGAEIELTHATSRLAAVAAAILAVRVDFIVAPFHEHRSAIPGANAFY